MNNDRAKLLQMTLTQVWGALLIFIVCPLLGGLPLISWITYGLTGRSLAQLGTGNVSVSAAFYHGGKWVGICAVLSEAAKGIAAVLIARAFFPLDPVWELVALLALVMGRYWLGKGAGTTNLVWGVVVHDPVAAGLIFLISGIGFTIWRQRRMARLWSLILLALILSLRHIQESGYVMVAIALAVLLGWIYQQIPDDLDLSTSKSQPESRRMFSFFRGQESVISLNQELDSGKVGGKAANLAQLKSWGYPVPDGWILLPGQDPAAILNYVQPSQEKPLVVRSSAVGEDSEAASAAGQYLTVLNVTDSEQLKAAIIDCFNAYDRPVARQYRQDRQQADAFMAVLVQRQIRGVFSGVAFSRNPVNQLDEGVLVEALPGDAASVVSGKVTPEQYRVYFPVSETKVVGEGTVPVAIIEEIAKWSREIEQLDRGLPQDLEWTYDGEQLWLLQTRPITTLQPLWTRKIAAEVIPGLIRPLTWSINRPLTCGVWGKIFTLVLGKRDRGLDFQETATLHFHRAYFNATLLGAIFQRMGLPPESLEFLTRGEKFSKPSFKSTLVNLPGLLRLLARERRLERDFQNDEPEEFLPLLEALKQTSASELSPQQLLARIEGILVALQKATYYSILAPLSFALRQKIFSVADADLDYSQTPEVASMRSLTNLAEKSRHLLPIGQLTDYSCAALFAYLAENPNGENILAQFQQWLDSYGYLGEVGTDIAVPRWREEPHPVREIFTQLLLTENPATPEKIPPKNWKTRLVQKRLNLKGKVTEVYSLLLAHLRWTFLALAKTWQQSQLISTDADIFFLELKEIRSLVQNSNPSLPQQLPLLIPARKQEFQQSQSLSQVPYLVYGQPTTVDFTNISPLPPQKYLQGIGASPGICEGKVKILLNLQSLSEIDSDTIAIVPYTDSGWAPLLSRAGGIVAEVGGRLSHGAILAREYGIPAVMDVHHATQLLQNGQRVRIDGQKGLVEILEVSNIDNEN